MTKSLQQLIPRASELFWAEPLALWTPILVADALSYGATACLNSLRHFAIVTLTSSSSVLYSGSETPTGRRLLAIYLLGVALRLAALYVTFFLYFLAFAVIAARIHTMNHRWSGAPIGVRRSAILAGWCMLMLPLAALVLTGVLRLRLLAAPQASSLLTFALMAMGSWPIMSPLLRLMSPQPNVHPSRSQRRAGWLALVAGQALSLFLVLGMTLLVNREITTPKPFFVAIIALVMSLIGAFPYIPAAILMTLVAEETVLPETPTIHQAISS